MQLTDDELLAIVDEATTALGELLLRHRQLREASLNSQVISASQERIEKRRAEIEKEREKIRKTRDVIRRRRELEKISRDHEKEATDEGKQSPRLVAVRNGRGAVIGWLQSAGGSKVNVLDRRGRVVAREVGGYTLSRRGGLAGAGRQGLRVLGQTLPKGAG